MPEGKKKQNNKPGGMGRDTPAKEIKSEQILDDEKDDLKKQVKGAASSKQELAEHVAAATGRGRGGWDCVSLAGSRKR